MRYTLLIFAIFCFPLLFFAQKDEKETTMKELVVTATGTQHTLKDVPVQTEVISRKMLDSFGGKSIEEILSSLTASFAFNEGDMGSQMQLGGLGNSYILVLVDGKRLHGDVGGENDLGLIDPQNIERIEIVKGAQSALYGSDAMAGVINIITKKRDVTKSLLIENSSRYGSYNDFRQHNGLGFGIGKAQSYTNFHLQRNDGWQNTTNEEAEGQVFTDSRNKTVNKFQNWQVSERFTYQYQKNLSMYASGSFYKKRIYRPTGQGKSFDTYFFDLLYNNASASVGGKYDINKTNYLSLDVDWSMHAYYHRVISDRYFGDGINSHGEFVTNYPYFRGNDILQSNQQRVLATAKGVFALPHNNLSTGVEYRYDYLKAPLRVQGGRADDFTLAMYAQDEYNPVKWLNITAGLRMNVNKGFGMRITPKFSAMFSVGDFRFRLNWGQGFKTPTPKELNYSYMRTMGGILYYYMGNKDLNPQTSNFVSANVEYRTSHITASVTGYYNKLDNMITLVTVPSKEIPSDILAQYWGLDPIARKYMNMENASTYGIDFNLTYNITNEISIGGAYSYLDTKANVYDTDKEKLVEVVIDGMAHHKGTVFATYNHRFCSAYKLGLGVYGRLSTKRYYQVNGDGAGYNIWRLTTTHDFGNSAKMSYRLEAGVDNIFNYVDRTMRPYHLGNTTSGTTFFVSLSVKFNSGKLFKNNINKQPKLENYEED